MNHLLSVILLVFMLACSSVQKEQQQQMTSKPNILFIEVDDLGYTDMAVMGSDYYETPHIDQLANKSTIFTNGYATCVVCSPSRASLLNGPFTARHGLTQYDCAKTGQK